MTKNKRPKNSNGVFKTIVREVVRDELKSTEKRLEERLDKRLGERLENTEKRLEERLDKRLEERLETTEKELEAKLDEKTRNLPTKDEFFTTMDKVMGELQTMRGEFTIHQGQHNEIDEHFEKLESTLHLG